ncbi:hypothetical protein DC522_08855 [Microvirga sp. KLBC 81]|uniref:hypothetical protein n=1 Tax=Microvirga sp. KLBC 81 TaxID=1862707 RepID=UPI000D507C39|nr:hypothetical protein [Microvirga sp. KLBC 81]PVE24724.1 hypothetical protein DC522_08855 [Microvirga sp. KLBC 81]
MQILKKLMALSKKGRATHDSLIISLDQLPALTRSWLTPLNTEDPELYDELAKGIVTDLAEREPQLDTILPAGHEDVRRVLRTLDLAGKQIGHFYFAPAPRAGRTVEEQLTAYNEKFRTYFTVEGDGVVLGRYGEDWVIATTGDLALLKMDSWGRDDQDMTLVSLGRDFGSFILAQANAYDAYQRFIVKDEDIENYRAAEKACAAHPAFQETNVALIFECQLKG